MYKIMGTYRGNTEEIDEAEDLKEARTLASDYRLAFGVGWTIKIKRSN